MWSKLDREKKKRLQQQAIQQQLNQPSYSDGKPDLSASYPSLSTLATAAAVASSSQPHLGPVESTLPSFSRMSSSLPGSTSQSPMKKEIAS